MSSPSATSAGRESWLDRIQRNHDRRTQFSSKYENATEARLQGESELLRDLWLKLSSWRYEQSAASELSDEALRAEVDRALQAIEYRTRLAEIAVTPEQFQSLVLDWVVGYGYVDTLRREVGEIQDLHVSGRTGAAYYHAGTKPGYTDLAPINDPKMLKWFVDRVTQGATPAVSVLDPLPPTNHLKERPGVRVSVADESAAGGYAVSIRFFPQTPMRLEDLVRRQMLTNRMAQWLREIYLAGASILIIGATSAGKSTVAYSLSEEVMDDRLIIVGNPLEIQHSNRYCETMEVREAGAEGGRDVDVAAYIRKALTMAPDRLVLTEARGGEMLPLLNGLSTGHGGSLTTIHADGIRQALNVRVPLMISQAEEGKNMSPWAVSSLLALAFDLAVYVEAKYVDGIRVRKVDEIALLFDADRDSNQVSTKTIFKLEHKGSYACSGISEFPSGLLSKADKKGLDFDGLRLTPFTDGLDEEAYEWNPTL